MCQYTSLRFHLHSTMFLLIQLDRFLATLPKDNLHSIMYLLILDYALSCARLTLFTFHNVSINSVLPCPATGCTVAFTFHNVSINSQIRVNFADVFHEFTFHNVSINSAMPLFTTTACAFIYIP